IELMRGQQLETVAYILDEAKRRDGAFADVIKEICGLNPKQLYEKVLVDCEVDQSTAVRTVSRSRQRPTYWTSWEMREEIPHRFCEFLSDRYYWEFEHYGRNYHEQVLNCYKYPHWREFAIAYLRYLKNTTCPLLKKHERGEHTAMHRIDRRARLLTYVSKEE